MDKRALISALNNLSVGEFSRIRSRLSALREELSAVGLDEVAGILAEAEGCLDDFDLKGFRKKVQHAVSRLGHVKEASASLATKLPRSLRG